MGSDKIGSYFLFLWVEGESLILVDSFGEKLE